MRKKYFLLTILLCSGTVIFSQKPAIDLQAIRQWQTASEGVISDDGTHVAYTIYNMPVGSRTLFVQSTNSNWKKEIVGGTQPSFAGNSTVIFKIKDSLGLF